MNSWLITGGAGFIGANFVRMAAGQTSANLLVLDALTYAGNFRNIESLVTEGQAGFVKGSICDLGRVRELFTEHDITRVINFAAESHVDRSISNPREFIDTNVLGTYTLLAAAADAWGSDHSDRLFLQVSTDEVYGDLAPEDAPRCESSPYRPSSPYSASKAAADHLCTAWARTYDFPVTITNCSNNYGPYQFPEKLIPLMINQAKSGKELPIYGDGMQIRDWLHVHDHCSALLAVVERGRPGETYCIGGDNERTNREVVESICDTVDAALGRETGMSRALITRVTDRPGHDRRYALDAGKIRRDLDWAPTIEFRDGLADTVRWYLDNTDWVEEITSGAYQDYYAQQYGSRQRLEAGVPQ
jgi:dTDP-glucose 4,6-dehydratase